MYVHIYIYIEREMYRYIHIHIYIYICIYRVRLRIQIQSSAKHATKSSTPFVLRTSKGPPTDTYQSKFRPDSRLRLLES